MTTIAWDGTSLVADKLVTDNHGLKSTVTKIFRENGNLVGFSGEAWLAQEFRAWVRDGGNPEKYPAKMKEGSGTGLVISSSRQIRIYEGGPYPIEMEQKYHAIGSGRDFAIAAMYLGKTAREAIAVAHQFNTGTGSAVDELRFQYDRVDPND